MEILDAAYRSSPKLLHPTTFRSTATDTSTRPSFRSGCKFFSDTRRIMGRLRSWEANAMGFRRHENPQGVPSVRKVAWRG